MATLKWIALFALAAYLGVAALMYFFQRNLMYFPDTRRTPPGQAGLPEAREIALATADGEKLVAWFAPPHEGKPLVLYFHGNGGALNLRANRFRNLIADGNGLLAVSYRGYGGSTGSPSETGLIADAMAGYAHAAMLVPPERIVVFGESLGTAVAVALASQKEIGALILDAPFMSAMAVAAKAYPFLPVRWLMRDPFRSDERMGTVKAPLLVLHGERDSIIHISFAEALYALAPEPKKFVRYPEGGHVNLDEHGATQAVRDFLAERYPAVRATN